MITTLLHLLRLFPFLCGGYRQLALENLALRHQLAVYKRTVTRPRLRRTDRLLWVWLARVWTGWRAALVIVAPDPVVRWQRRRFRAHWTKLFRRPTGGRPPVNTEINALVTRMAAANPLWGAPRIHGELQKLGIEVFVLVVLAHHRRRLVPFNVTEHPTAAWTARQLVEAFPDDTTPAYVLRDRDHVYSHAFRQRVKGMGILEVLTGRPESLAESLRGTAHRLDPPRVSGPWPRSSRAAPWRI